MANPEATGTESVPPWRIRGPRLVSDFLSPAVRRVAAALGVDPAAVTGTGTDGRVTREDVALGGPPSELGDEIEPFNNVRKRAAGLLLASKQTSAHTLVIARADYSAIEAVARRSAHDVLAVRRARRVRRPPGLSARQFLGRR